MSFNYFLILLKFLINFRGLIINQKPNNMKNFFTALFWFLVLVFFTLLFHYFYGEKLCGVCHKGVDNAIQEQVKTVPDANVVQKLTQFMITDTNGSTGNYILGLKRVTNVMNY